MLKFKCWLLLKIFFAANITLVSSQVYADGYLTPTDLKKINYQCYLEETKIIGLEFDSNVLFEENKITIETANIQIPTADPDAWQNYNPTQVEADVNEYLDTYSRGNLTEGGLFRNEDNTVSVKPGPPLTIELNSGNAGYTSIIHTDNTRLNLDPSAANIFTG